METVLEQIRFELGLNLNTRKESTILTKAQDYTGLKTPGKKTLLKAIRKQHQREIKAREQKAAKRHNISRKEYLDLRKKAWEILKDFDSGYKMGDEKFLLINKKIIAELDEREEYAASCKYRASHGSVDIFMTKKDLRNIEKIGGIWTIRLENNKCKVLTGKGKYTGFTVDFETYYLVGNSHADTLREAQVLEAKKRKVSSKTFSDKDFISVDNIRKLGACEMGIDRFCEKHNLNKEYGYQLGYLKQLNGAGTNYFEKLSK